MSQKSLRIVSRQSPLALWQANHVREQLVSQHPDLDIEITGITTQADRFLNRSLFEMGGKGAFVKELEQALLEGQADIAVHSMKDVPVDLPDGLTISAMLKREDICDVLVSTMSSSVDELHAGSVIGTSSLRRRCQLLHFNSDLDIKDIRGNLETRLKKLDQGLYDALILASAGLKRLGFNDRIAQMIPVDILLPAAGQGALGIETRRDDSGTNAFVSVLNHEQTQECIEAERSVSRTLNGGCHAPVGAYARLDKDNIIIDSIVGNLDGSRIIKCSINGKKTEGSRLGVELAEELLSAGADRILKEVML